MPRQAGYRTAAEPPEVQLDVALNLRKPHHSIVAFATAGR
jgi:hypothetical protein